MITDERLQSFLPESPRYLISKDRYDEAQAILVKYHAEGDTSSLFVKAELAQIEKSIKLEMEDSKQSWFGMYATPLVKVLWLIITVSWRCLQDVWDAKKVVHYGFLGPVYAVEWEHFDFVS
jgi:hypothetical protein